MLAARIFWLNSWYELRLEVLEVLNALPVPMLRQVFLRSLLRHFAARVSCVVLERVLEAVFGVPGSILGSFWVHVGHFLDDFWCQVRYVKICTPLERESNFQGSGGSRITHFSFFFQL